MSTKIAHLKSRQKFANQICKHATVPNIEISTESFPPQIEQNSYGDFITIADQNFSKQHIPEKQSTN